MTTTGIENEIVHFDKKFGIITEKQVVITNGVEKNKINFESIQKINLIKSRTFFLNTIYFGLSVLVFSYTFLIHQHNNHFIFYGLILSAVLLLVYSLLFKFYNYNLIIKEKNKSVVNIKTTQIHRKNIKEFYLNMCKQLPNKK